MQKHGWTYGTVDKQLVQLLRTNVQRVHWKDDKDDKPNEEIFEQRSKDKSFHPTHSPDVVVFPRNAEEVSSIIKICAKSRVPVVPRGAGSGLEGGCIPYLGGVVCDTRELNRISIDKENMQVTVGAGVLKDELQAALLPHGLFFGPDPSSNPSLGGMASTSGSGLSTLKYGTTRENIVSLLVVTAAGDILTTRSRVRKASTGYELTQLFIGAEGTLGLIVELTVKVRKIQEHCHGALVTFPTVVDAASTVVAMMASPPNTLVRCEMLNGKMVEATNVVYSTTLDVLPTLFLEFRADSLEEIQRDSENFAALARAHRSERWTIAEDSETYNKLWQARRGCYFTSFKYRQLPSPDRVYITDVCVPLSKLVECVATTEEIFESAGFPCLLCAHISDGNFHALVPYQENEKEKVIALDGEVIKKVVAMGGAVSGEHGVGVGKMKYMELEHGKEHVDVQRRIKMALDPFNIMNPQKMFTLEKVDCKACL